jgi:hypothetical protein
MENSDIECDEGEWEEVNEVDFDWIGEPFAL